MVDEQMGSGSEAVIMDVYTRIRSLEGKYNLLRDRALIINQNMITQYQKGNSEITSINDELKEIKHTLFQIKETLKHVITELENTPRKEELRVLEKYINLWNPMKFVSEEEVRRIIREEKSKKSDK